MNEENSISQLQGAIFKLYGSLGLESVGFGSLRGCRVRGASEVMRQSMQEGVEMTLPA